MLGLAGAARLPRETICTGKNGWPRNLQERPRLRSKGLVSTYHALSSASVVKIAPSIDISTFSSSSWMISSWLICWPSDGSRLHAKKIISSNPKKIIKENYQQDLAITECQTTSTIRDLADGRLGQHYPRPRRWTLGSTIRDLADGRWAALSATSQMDADTRNGTYTHEGYAWQLTLF